MGYDMYREGISAEDEAEVERLQLEVRTMNRLINAKREVLAGIQAVGAVDLDLEAEIEELVEKQAKLWTRIDQLRGYFRLNIWGMGTAREVMHQLGMLDVESWHADFPEWSEGADEDAHAAACRRVTDAQARLEPTGIPVYKLGTNDGWLVTPDEVRAALAKWDAHQERPAGLPEWFGDWVEWLRSCRIAGFRVH